MYKPGWKRDLHIRWATLIKHEGKILITERNCYLVCIDPKTGNLIWEFKIYNAYGWLTVYKGKVFYLGQDGVLKIIDFYSGKCIADYPFIFRYMGYVLVKDRYLLTGAWRGYTDFACYNLESNFKLEWKKDTKSKEIKAYSIPIFYNDCVILSDNSNQIISSLDIKTGSEKWSLKLPDNIGSLDLDYTFQIDNGQVVVYSKCGKIYYLDEQELRWKSTVKHSTGIETIKPKILNSQYLFQDAANNICSYNKTENKLQWKIYSNHKQSLIPAIEIKDELTLICLAMHRKMIINKVGEIIRELNSERRYASDLIEINEDVFYLTKSELKQLKLK